MKKTISCISLFLITATVALASSPIITPVTDAPDDNVFVRYDQALGIGYSAFAEDLLCLTYQQWLTPRFGYTVGGGAMYNGRVALTGHKNSFDFAGFGQLQWALYTAANPFMETRLYTWVMGGFDCKQNVFTADDVLLTNACFGAGFGFDITALKHLSIPLEFGYAVQGPSDFKISMTGQSGIRYRF